MIFLFIFFIFIFFLVKISELFNGVNSRIKHPALIGVRHAKKGEGCEGGEVSY